MQPIFLTAEWRNLIMANYEIAPQELSPFVPEGTELDLWQGRCYISLVGFLFVHTKVMGLSIPFHRNFEEVNLRFYVRFREEGAWKRGVVFIKEIVPKRAITAVANALYGEKYVTMPMRHRWEQAGARLLVRYEWKPNGEWNSLFYQKYSSLYLRYPVNVKYEQVRTTLSFAALPRYASCPIRH